MKLASKDPLINILRYIKIQRLFLIPYIIIDNVFTCHYIF